MKHIEDSNDDVSMPMKVEECKWFREPCRCGIDGGNCQKKMVGTPYCPDEDEKER